MDGCLYLEDLHVGQRFESATLAVTADEIKAFARQFDPQPFHLDEDAAARSLLGGLAASGWHTAALTMRLLVGGGAPIAGGVIGAGVEVRWPRPVRPGDELEVVSEVLEITALALQVRPRHRRFEERDAQPAGRGGAGADLEASGAAPAVVTRYAGRSG